MLKSFSRVADHNQLFGMLAAANISNLSCFDLQEFVDNDGNKVVVNVEYNRDQDTVTVEIAEHGEYIINQTFAASLDLREVARQERMISELLVA